jgi:MFS family permease
MASLVKQPPLFPILLVNFVGTLGFSVVLPFLVFLVMKFGGNAIVYGLLAATYPAFQLIGAPVLGRWSDIFGRKKVLLLSNEGTSVVGYYFFLHYFYPLKNLLALISHSLEHLSLLFHCLSYFLPELLTALLVAISLLPMLILRTFHQIELGVKTLEKWRYLPTLGLF